MQTCSRCQNTLTPHNTLSRHRVCLACSWPRYSLADAHTLRLMVERGETLCTICGTGDLNSLRFFEDKVLLCFPCNVEPVLETRTFKRQHVQTILGPLCTERAWLPLAPLDLDPDDYACPKCRVQIIRIILKER